MLSFFFFDFFSFSENVYLSFAFVLNEISRTILVFGLVTVVEKILIELYGGIQNFHPDHVDTFKETLR